MDEKVEQSLAHIIVENDNVFIPISEDDICHDNSPVGRLVRSDSTLLEIQIYESPCIIQLNNASDGNVLLEIRQNENVSKSIARIKHNGQGRFTLKKLRVVHEIQMRKYARVDAKVSYMAHLLDNDKKPGVILPCLQERTSIISAGGFQFYCRTFLESNSYLHLRIDLPGLGTVSSQARVVRVEEVSRDRQIYSVAVEFTDISDSDRQIITEFVEKKQGSLKLTTAFASKV